MLIFKGGDARMVINKIDPKLNRLLLLREKNIRRARESFYEYCRILSTQSFIKPIGLISRPYVIYSKVFMKALSRTSMASPIRSKY